LGGPLSGGLGWGRPPRDLSSDEAVVDRLRRDAQLRGNAADRHLFVDVEPSQEVGIEGFMGISACIQVKRE
jgi:hypothetical protein